MPTDLFNLFNKKTLGVNLASSFHDIVDTEFSNFLVEYPNGIRKTASVLESETYSCGIYDKKTKSRDRGPFNTNVAIVDMKKFFFVLTNALLL
jgi:hypothetical protein